MLLKAAELLARDGALPVNLRFACDGEEETGGHSIVEFLEADERGADACVIFDSGMIERGRPAFNVATRGLLLLPRPRPHGRRDLHSGMYGGAALNALHAIGQALGAAQAVDGRLPGTAAAGDRAADRRGARELARAAVRRRGAREAGARPIDAGGRRGLLDAHVGRAGAGRERARGRLAAPAEDRAAGARRGERVDPARSRAGSADDRRCVPAARARGRSRGRRGRDRAALVQRPRPDRSRRAGDPARPGRASSVRSARGRC